MADDEPDWRQYEREVHKRLEELGGDDSTVEFDQSIRGRYSGAMRQVDAVITGGYAGEIDQGVKAVVDCKFYKGKVDVKGMEAFMGLVDDNGYEMGFIVTTEGFSKAAKNRSEHGGRAIKLRVMPRIIIYDFEHPPYVPSYDEAHYSGEFWEGNGPDAVMGALIRYSFVEESGYTLESVDDLEWLDDVIGTGKLDELNWSNGSERINCARIILRHYLGKEPTDEEIESFLAEFESELEDGQLWTIYLGEIREKTGLWANIQTFDPEAELYDLDEDL